MTTKNRYWASDGVSILFTYDPRTRRGSISIELDFQFVITWEFMESGSAQRILDGIVRTGHLFFERCTVRTSNHKMGFALEYIIEGLLHEEINWEDFNDGKPGAIPFSISGFEVPRRPQISAPSRSNGFGEDLASSSRVVDG